MLPFCSAILAAASPCSSWLEYGVIGVLLTIRIEPPSLPAACFNVCFGRGAAVLVEGFAVVSTMFFSSISSAFFTSSWCWLELPYFSIVFLARCIFVCSSLIDFLVLPPCFVYLGWVSFGFHAIMLWVYLCLSY